MASWCFPALPKALMILVYLGYSGSFWFENMNHTKRDNASARRHDVRLEGGFHHLFQVVKCQVRFSRLCCRCNDTIVEPASTTSKHSQMVPTSSVSPKQIVPSQFFLLNAAKATLNPAEVHSPSHAAAIRQLQISSLSEHIQRSSTCKMCLKCSQKKMTYVILWSTNRPGARIGKTPVLACTLMPIHWTSAVHRKGGAPSSAAHVVNEKQTRKVTIKRSAFRISNEKIAWLDPQCTVSIFCLISEHCLWVSMKN